MPSAGARSYTIAFSPTLDFITKTLLATLSSPQLDEKIHGGHSVEVSFPGKAYNVPMTIEDLDAYHIRSLEQYVEMQIDIRADLEKVLIPHLEKWDTEQRLGRGGAIWKSVKAKHVSFLLPLRELGGIDAAWQCSVFLQAKWRDGHQRIVHFAHGSVPKLAIEG